MKKAILITGGNGFVGRHVLAALGMSSSPIRLVGRNFNVDQYGSLPVETIYTPDLFAEELSWWSDVCADVDTVIHIAWYAEPGEYLQSPRNLDCLIGTLRMAKGAAKAGVRRFVGIGTCFEYDVSYGSLSVETCLRPLTPYAAAKAACWMALSQWLHSQGVEFAWCRLFYLYGDGENSKRLVPYIRSQLSAGEFAELTSGTQVRDYLDVQEAAKMIVEVAFGKRQGAVNICSGVPITIRQLAEGIADEYGRRDLLKFGVRPDNSFDPPRVIGVK